MGLFNRSRMKKAEDLAVRIGENLLKQSLLDPSQQGHGQQELVQGLARLVCEANPAWRIEEGFLERRGRTGEVSVTAYLGDLRTALDLLGVVIDADLREHARLPQRDHDEVLMRALGRLSTALEHRSLSEVSESLAHDLETEALWEELASSGDDPEEIAGARAQLEELADGLLAASYGARAEIGSYTNEDPVNSIYADMVWAVLEQDYPFLSDASVRELTLAAMRAWDRELAALYLRASHQDGAAEERIARRA